MVAACGQGDKDADQTPAQATLEVPLVWQTPLLRDDLSSFAIVEERPFRLIVAFEGNGVALIDEDGAAVGSEGPYLVESVGTGVTTVIDGATLTLFPGIERNDGRLGLYAAGKGLVAPVEIGVEGAGLERLTGVCAANVEGGNALVRIGYFSSLSPATLVEGTIRSVDNVFRFERSGETVFDKDITACDISGETTVVGGRFGLSFIKNGVAGETLDTSDVPVSVAADTSPGGTPYAVMTYSNGSTHLAKRNGTIAPLAYREALSAKSPARVGHLAIATTNVIGSLGDGFLALESERGDEGSQILYADLAAIRDAVDAEE